MSNLIKRSNNKKLNNLIRMKKMKNQLIGRNWKKSSFLMMMGRKRIWTTIHKINLKYQKLRKKKNNNYKKSFKLMSLTNKYKKIKMHK